MNKNISIREYLSDPSAVSCNNFYDWFCKDASLPKKQEKLDKKVRKLVASTKIDVDTMYVWYKNNCPGFGNLYDDIRFSDLQTGKVIFTIVPRSGHKSDENRAEVWGRENNFQEPLAHGTWKEVRTFFGV